MTLREIQQLVARMRYRYSRKVRDFIEDGYYDEEDLVHMCPLKQLPLHNYDLHPHG
jgi:hypothetical protein